MQNLSTSFHQSKFFARMQAALGQLLNSIPRSIPGDHYQPEKHYMRGPGPKTRLAQRRTGRPSKPAPAAKNDRHSQRA